MCADLLCWCCWCYCCLQLSVLQTAEEGKGPGAFQMLQYIKLQVDPQVQYCLGICCAALAALQALADGNTTRPLGHTT
jgi:hypothetical protein